jgi:antitoxin MazE
MKTRIQKWGNSLAVRIPKAYAEEAGLGENSTVDISMSDKNLILKPLTKARLTLDMLLSGITQDNIHSEMDWGKPEGREEW